MGDFRGSKNQKSGKFHELPRKRIFLTPPPRMERGRGGREGGDMEGERGGRQAGRKGAERSRVTS